MQEARALVLGDADRRVLLERLAKALLRFQERALQGGPAPTGLLCQVRWAHAFEHGSPDGQPQPRGRVCLGALAYAGSAQAAARTLEPLP